MNNRTLWSAAWVVIALLLAPRCTTDIAGGGGSEAGNARVVGMVTDVDGTPMEQVIVTLLPADYDPRNDAPPADSCIDTTTADGAYRFSVAKGATYSVEAVENASGLRALLTDVQSTENVDTLASCLLQPPGTIQLLFSDTFDVEYGYLYIPGTTISGRLNETDHMVVFDRVPAGRIPSVCYKTTNGSDPVVLRHAVEVASGGTVILPWQGWNHSGRVVLNTSASGADVPGDVDAFPLLIRFNADNFDFTQAQSGGGDIRFTSENGSPLPHEIEEWDAGAGQAALWVRVDTLRGNDSTQSILVFWGNPGAADASHSAAVFDTAAGFQGVWHFSEAAGSAGAHDATGNGYHGTPYGAGSVADGMIAGARLFDGTSSYLELAGTADSKLAFPENGEYTLSAWAYATAIDSAAHYIVSKSNRNYNLDLSGNNLWEVYDLRSEVGWESNFAEAHAGEWLYLTGVRSGDRMRLYVNGTCVDSTIDTTASSSSRDTTFNVHIGKRAESDYGFWSGMIDELTMCNRSQSADWIRLCYMNQRHDDRLIRFDNQGN